MKRAWVITFREVRNYLQDKADLAFSLVLPIATFALLYGAFGGQGDFHGTAYIVNEDNGAYSQQLIDTLKKNKSLTVEILTRQDAENKLSRSDITLALFIPADYSQQLSNEQAVQLAFMQRGNGGQEGQIVGGIIRGTVSELNQSFSVISQVESIVSNQGIPQDKIHMVTLNYLDRERRYPLVGVSEIAIGNKPNLVNEFLPGIITMYILFAISISAAGIVEERRKGTLERLLTTRLTLGELFTGKFLASVARGFVQTLILLLLSWAVFGLFTPLVFLECLLVTLIFVMASSAIGMFIASISRTQDTATWIGVFFTMIMTMLGGTFFTISKGTALYTLSKISINGYANDAFKTLISKGATISGIGLELVIMIAVTIGALLISRLVFKAIPQGK
ncbi:MAG: ABC transporter permease [Dehalococcoidales bacterium]|nr:ABC transporter permease [Dehalococcoidales bacterium]